MSNHRQKRKRASSSESQIEASLRKRIDNYENDYGVMSGTDEENDCERGSDDLEMEKNYEFCDYDDDEKIDQRYPNLFIYHRELYKFYQRDHKSMIDAIPFQEERARYELFKNKKVIPY